MQLRSKLLILICLLAVPVNALETQKIFFKAGFTVPYNQEYVDEVLYEPEDVTSKILPLELTFKEPLSFTQFNFYLVQALDVYTTYYGLKYSCVSEANPLVPGGSKPSAAELVLFKVAIIGLIKSIYGQDPEEWQFFQAAAIYTTSIAVANNFQVISDAKEECPKQRR